MKGRLRQPLARRRASKLDKTPAQPSPLTTTSPITTRSPPSSGSPISGRLATPTWAAAFRWSRGICSSRFSLRANGRSSFVLPTRRGARRTTTMECAAWPTSIATSHPARLRPRWSLPPSTSCLGTSLTGSAATSGSMLSRPTAGTASARRATTAPTTRLTGRTLPRPCPRSTASCPRSVTQRRCTCATRRAGS